MARKNYSPEFRRDAVELYRATKGATIAGIASDLGITDATLSVWCRAAGVPVRGRRPGPDDPGEPLVAADELSRLRARVAELEATQQVLSSERDILRAAAKYFAGETNW